MSGHHHHHHHDTHRGGGSGHADIDWAVMASLIEANGEVHAPATEQAAHWLRERLGDASEVHDVWDVGSGPGVAAGLFAQVFPSAAVLAVDGEQALLERARARAARLGVGDRLRTLTADLPDGLVDAGAADLIWSSKALHHLGDQTGAVARLADHLRPGGLLAVAEGGLPARCLPRDFGIGRPGLQARLDAVVEDWFTEMRAALPDVRTTVEDWPAMLAAAGLTDLRSRTFLLDLPAPLSAAARDYLRAQLVRLRETVAENLDAEDRATLDRLVDPDDKDGILLRSDAFLLSAQTVHTGRRAAV
ncbi:trans-aconitate 2-methyltransferase [Streptomyces sp. SAJ15]|uniref:class I SAM-dependent methyltransferase n=1 Tax=Streptomyces sp. SAJ15 TaxID=2011095 RepID=UPI0011855EE2|nr:class I SAM-dependent methyltransferase [Streptomyces sp. SAJ15]TVL92978.1 SAM-dependent methyltransferase [Streptomyces sp. SAJ15]